MKHAIAKLPTPLLNTPDFTNVFRYPMNLDSQGLLRAVEAVALPGTKFRITSFGDICKVATEDYPGCEFLYADRRFLQEVEANFPERKKEMPSLTSILDCLRSHLRKPYIWGGNWGRGIQEMLALYPPSVQLDPKTKALWTLSGLDCSGLLYEATDGAVPRNTSELVRYGEAVPIRGKRASEITKELQPLDLIVWAGHVIIVENERYTIESRNPIGVIRSSLTLRLHQVMQEREAVDDWDSASGLRFVIRRLLGVCQK